MTLRSDLLKIAADLPKGNPTRRELFAALKGAVRPPEPGDAYYGIWEESEALGRDLDRAFRSGADEGEVVDWIIARKPSNLAVAYEVFIRLFPNVEPGEFEKLWKARGGPRLRLLRSAGLRPRSEVQRSDIHYWEYDGGDGLTYYVVEKPGRNIFDRSFELVALMEFPDDTYAKQYKENVNSQGWAERIMNQEHRKVRKALEGGDSSVRLPGWGHAMSRVLDHIW